MTRRLMLWCALAAFLLLPVGVGKSVAAPQPPKSAAAWLAVDEAAEDLQDHLLAGSWSKADAGVSVLQRALRLAAGTVTGGVARGVVVGSAPDVVTLVSSVAQRDTLAAERAANAIDRRVLDVLALVAPRPPFDVRILDVAGRDLLYSAHAADWPAADRALREWHEHYARLAPRVAGRNAKMARQVARHLGAAQRAVAAHRATAAAPAAAALLEDVDAVESLY